MRTKYLILILTIGLISLAWPGMVTAQAPDPAPQPRIDTGEAPESTVDPDDPDDEAAKPKAPTPADLFTQGRDAMFQGKYQKAIDLLTKAVEGDKTKTSYRLYLARAYRYADKDDKAAEHLEKIVKTAPDHVEAGQTLAEIYSTAKKFKDVVRILEPLLKYRHDYPTYHMLAEAQYNLGEHAEARKHYEEAIKLNPKSASDHYQLGNIYLSDNSFALAANSYQSALDLGLESPVLHYKLGSAYFNLRNYFGPITTKTVKSGKTGTIHEKWYLIEPVPGKKDLFRCAPEKSAVYQVAKALADGIEERPEIHVLQATIYLNARRYAQAYDMFIKIGPTVPKESKALFHYYCAQAAFGTGRYDEYLQQLQKAIELNKEAYGATLVDAYLSVADQHNQAGNLKGYIEFMEKAVAESPQNASLHLKLGEAYEEIQEYPKAVAQWRMVLDLESDHPQRMKLLNQIEKYSSMTAPATDTKKPK